MLFLLISSISWRTVSARAFFQKPSRPRLGDMNPGEKSDRVKNSKSCRCWRFFTGARCQLRVGLRSNRLDNKSRERFSARRLNINDSKTPSSTSIGFSSRSSIMSFVVVVVVVVVVRFDSYVSRSLFSSNVLRLSSSFRCLKSWIFRWLKKLWTRYWYFDRLIGCRETARRTSRDNSSPEYAWLPLELWWNIFCIYIKKNSFIWVKKIIIRS